MATAICRAPSPAFTIANGLPGYRSLQHKPKPPARPSLQVDANGLFAAACLFLGCPHRPGRRPECCYIAGSFHPVLHYTRTAKKDLQTPPCRLQSRYGIIALGRVRHAAQLSQAGELERPDPPDDALLCHAQAGGQGQAAGLGHQRRAGGDPDRHGRGHRLPRELWRAGRRAAGGRAPGPGGRGAGL